MKGGFDPSYLYEVVYTAKDPKVHGLGFAATRDLNSYLRYGTQDDTGTPNILGGRIAWAISQGNSQSGTFLRSFIHLGFNQDLAGANRLRRQQSRTCRTPLGHEYPIRGSEWGSRMYEAGSDGVVWWGDTPTKPDAIPRRIARPLRGHGNLSQDRGDVRFGGVLPSTCVARLVGTSADRDIPLPSNVRRYYFPGVRHGGGRGGFDPDPQPAACCGLIPNPNPSSDTLRALQTALVEWSCEAPFLPRASIPTRSRRTGTADTSRAGIPHHSRRAVAGRHSQSVVPI